MAKNETTSKRVATKASQLLKSKKSTNKVRSVSASALTQTKDKPKKKKSR